MPLIFGKMPAMIPTERHMRNLRVIFNILLTCWLLAIGIDGFWGGATAGQVGAVISLVGGAVSFLLLIVPSCRRPTGDKS